MKLRSWILAASLASCVLSMRAEAYPGGGVPNVDLSCYGKCGGKSPTSGTTKCYCDSVCNLRGDCCADRDEFCAPAVAKTACSLTTSIATGSDICGTDLGFVYQHGNRMEILFGDTWEWPANTATKNPVVPEGQPMPEVGKPQPAGQVIECRDRGEDLVKSDDMQGFIPVSRPSSMPLRAKDAVPPSGSGWCGPAILTPDMDPNRPMTFQTVTLRDSAGTEMPMPPGSTPLAGFSDGTSAWGVFSQGALGNNPRVYLGKRRGDGNARDRATYDTKASFEVNAKFLSPSVARITSYDDTAPNIKSNYATPTGTTPGVMLMFGRPKFMSKTEESVHDNAMYLIKHTLPFTEWKPLYFSGFEGEKPLWTETASLATKVIDDDFKVTGQIDIKWVPQIGKWLMLYGGDIEWYFLPPYPTDQPRHGAIHMRLADHPWGPWSRATPLLWREDMGKFIKCDAVLTAGCDQYPPAGPVPAGCNWFSFTYDPGDFTAGRPCSDVSACRSDLPQPVQPNVLCPNGSRHQHGELYAANLIPTWTYDANNTIDAATNMKTTTIYFTVSTWMPYQVLIAAADLKLPVNMFGKFKVQLRDLNKKMIVVDTASMTGTANTTPAGGNGKGGPTSWLVLPAGSTPNNRGPRIGDTVAFVGTNAAGNSKFLARDSGHGIVFPVITPTIPTSAQWLIESPIGTPVGTPIVVGKTPVKFLSVSSGTRHLKSKVNEGLIRAYDGSGTEAAWMFSWGCIGGDTCPARSVSNP